MSSILWIGGISLISFLISAFFSGYLAWKRRLFLIPYLGISSILIFFYFRINPIVEGFWSHNWLKGLIAFIIIGAFLVRNVWSQPYTRKEGDNWFIADLLWYGLAYGIIDGLLLNVLPVVTVAKFGISGYDPGLWSMILSGLTGITASLIVTLFYHMGYKEFRNRSVLKVLLGNALITLAFIVSGNPIAAVLCHATMHVAAVIRGPETTLQLPPHYNK
jgi:hypothetical protein